MADLAVSAEVYEAGIVALHDIACGDQRCADRSTYEPYRQRATAVVDAVAPILFAQWWIKQFGGTPEEVAARAEPVDGEPDDLERLKQGLIAEGRRQAAEAIRAEVAREIRDQGSWFWFVHGESWIEAGGEWAARIAEGSTDGD